MIFYTTILKITFYGERVRTSKITSSKVKKRTSKVHECPKRTSKIRTSKVSIKVIRMSKDQNDDNYLWRSTYGYQGLWGVRLGSVRLGLVRTG